MILDFLYEQPLAHLISGRFLRNPLWILSLRSFPIKVFIFDLFTDQKLFSHLSYSFTSICSFVNNYQLTPLMVVLKESSPNQKLSQYNKLYCILMEFVANVCVTMFNVPIVTFHKYFIALYLFLIIIISHIFPLRSIILDKTDLII